LIFFAKTHRIAIFTDGACSGNPGPGGWGAIVVNPEGAVKELGGKVPETTNNRMELTATIASLVSVRKDLRPVTLYTDSTYVIRGITQWIWGWRKNGWKNGDGNEVLNRDLWEDLLSVVSARGAEGKISWLYSRGHVGTPGNERCDEIAVAFSQGKWVELYSGPLLKYSVAIFDLPEDSELPEMRQREEKKVAHSYLSFLGGEVYRHSDWASCERRVKGRSGAKFKKAMSAADEPKILAEWGLSPDAISKIKT
jgi:ribonuclease HI